MKKFLVEFIGTFWLVLMGCGSAIFAAGFPDVGIGLVGVSIAFGLSVLTIAYALGHISGAHLNPAVTIGLWTAGRVEGKLVMPYIVSQILGAILGALVLYFVLVSNCIDIGGFAANGYGEYSPGGYNIGSAMLVEFLMTFMFLLVIIGVTGKDSSIPFAGLTIGLALTLIHLVSIPITNTSVNPARSISQAIFVGGDVLGQLWLFIVFPILGAAMAGIFSRYLMSE